MTKQTPAQVIKELKDTIKDLHAQSEKDKTFYRGRIDELQDESNNLELALKKCINSKAELNNTVDQLKDDLEEAISEKDGAREALTNALGDLFFILHQWKKANNKENDDGE